MIFPIQFMFYYILTVWRYLFIHLSIVFSCFPSTNAIADTDILHMYIIIAVIIIDKGVRSPSNGVPFFLLNRVPHTLHLYSCSLFFWCPFFTTCSWLTMPYISQFSFGHAWLWSVRFRPRFFILVFHHFQIFIKILKPDFERYSIFKATNNIWHGNKLNFSSVILITFKIRFKYLSNSSKNISKKTNI